MTTIRAYAASLSLAKGIQYKNGEIRITNPDLAKLLGGLKLLRTPFRHQKLARIFARLNSAYSLKTFDETHGSSLEPLFLGTDAEHWAATQTRDVAPGVYAEITDKGRFFGGAAIFVRGASENTVIVSVYRVDEQGQTWLRALFGFNLSAA